MRKACLIFVNSLKRMRLLLVTSVLLGALLCLLFSTFVNIAVHLVSEVTVGYTDNDGSAVSADFERYATEQLGFRLVEGEEADLESELVEKHLSALIEVPAGFGEAVRTGESGALLVTYMDDFANRVFLQAYLEEYATSLAVLATAAGGDEERFERLLEEAHEQTAEVSVVPLDTARIQQETDWEIFRNTIGFFLMLSLLITVGVANILYDDNAAGTYRRMRASNVTAPSYVGGICAAGFIAALLMVVVHFVYLLLIGKGAHLSLGPTFVLCLLFGLFEVGFALVCGLLIKTRMGILWAIISVSTPLTLLGGAFFPIDTAPAFMQQLAHISPMFWFMEAVEGLRDGNGEAWLLSVGILALFALLCYLIAGVRFATRERSVG